MAFVGFAVPAQAANTFYAPGDLILFVQKFGNTNTVYASLGNAATYRGAAAGSDANPSLNILNLNTTLESAFGTDWENDTDIFVGIAGVWGTDNTGDPTLQDGDPNRTLYVSDNRNSLGNPAIKNSTGYSVSTNTNMTTAANNITSMSLPFENNYNVGQTISLTSESNIDNQNPFLGSNPTTAFGVFGGGIQQRGTAGDLGSISYGGIGSVEFALDLYRILAVNNVPGQVGGTVRQGSFEGSFLLGSNGSVSFIPEPSSFTLAGIAAASLLLRRRRSA